MRKTTYFLIFAGGTDWHTGNGAGPPAVPVRAYPNEQNDHLAALAPGAAGMLTASKPGGVEFARQIIHPLHRCRRSYSNDWYAVSSARSCRLGASAKLRSSDQRWP